MRVVVVGADAVGATAASGVKRALLDAVEVVVLERQDWTSYSACGIPFWIGGQVRIEVIAARDTGRVLGCQIVGGAGAGKRIDAMAVAIWDEMTVEDVVGLTWHTLRRSRPCGIR